MAPPRVTNETLASDLLIENSTAPHFTLMEKMIYKWQLENPCTVLVPLCGPSIIGTVTLRVQLR